MRVLVMPQVKRQRFNRMVRGQREQNQKPWEKSKIDTKDKEKQSSISRSQLKHGERLSHDPAIMQAGVDPFDH